MKSDCIYIYRRIHCFISKATSDFRRKMEGERANLPSVSRATQSTTGTIA